MALRKAHTVKWPPRGLTDAIDAGSSFPGAMAMLVNLIPAQNEKSLWVPRPGSTLLTALPDYGGGPVTALITVGNIAYGMYASATFSGKDRPFVYNMATGAFLSISGITSGNLPTSQPITGDWTPPTVAQVGSRIVFTHPGFPGGQTVSPPGYFAFHGNIVTGSNVITGNSVIAGFGPNLIGLVLSVFGASGIPAGTTATAFANVTGQTTASGTGGTPTITVASATNMAIGQQVAIPSDGDFTTITNIVGTTVTLAANLNGNITSAALYFYGTTITMSANATNTINTAVITGYTQAAIKFGWLDLSGFTLTTLANTTNGIPVLTGNPTILGIQPGMTVSGPNIPANTIVEQFSAVTFSATGSATTNSTTINNVVSMGAAIPAPGMTVSGVGISPGTQVANWAPSTSTLTLTQPFTGTTGTITINFAGADIILSASPTVNAQGVQVTIAGGSAASPQWAAGDTNQNGLAAVPVFVAQFSGRAYFGVNTTSPNIGGVTASDSGIACQVSNANQIITFNDGLFVTSGVGLALFNQLGGIIQSLMVFQDDSNIRQITGDFALGNWSQNSLLTATGTSAPNAIASTPRGILFIAPDGMRLIDFDARVSDPIGADGDGLVLPFTNAVTPTRMQGDYNENIYRLTVTWQPPASVAQVWGTVLRTDEFWFHLPKSISAPIEQGRWSGPHPSTMDQLAPWGTKSSFLVAPTAARGFFYRGDVIPTTASAYTEFSGPMNWTMTTPLLPDDEEMMMNAVGRSSIFSEIPSTTQLLASVTDDHGNLLAQGYIWEGPTTVLRHLRIGWDQGFEFRQASFSITGQSAATIQLGTMAHTFQRLGKSQADFPIEFILGQSILGGPDVLGP